METTCDNMSKEECRLHSLSNCEVCLSNYDGSYSLDIENPIHQAAISHFLAKSRRKNYRELIYARRYCRRRFVERVREQRGGSTAARVPGHEEPAPGTCLIRKIGLADPQIRTTGQAKPAETSYLPKWLQTTATSAKTCYSAQWLSLPSTSRPATDSRLKISPFQRISELIQDTNKGFPRHMTLKNNLPKLTCDKIPIWGKLPLGRQTNVRRSLMPASKQPNPVDVEPIRMSSTSDSTSLLKNWPEVVETPLTRRLFKLTSPNFLIGATSDPSSALSEVNGSNCEMSIREHHQLTSASCKYSSRSAFEELSSLPIALRQNVLESAVDPSTVLHTAESSKPKSMHLDENGNIQQGLPLPPFETISGKFPKGIKEYWNKSTASDGENQHKEPNSDIQKIIEWLVQTTTNSPLQLPPASADSSFRDILPESDTSQTSTNKNRQKTAKSTRPLHGRITKTRTRRNRDQIVVVSEETAFIVSSHVFEKASPFFKKVSDDCPFRVFCDGQEYRGFRFVGIPTFALYELLNFISCRSYNHSVMRSSQMKKFLEMLNIQYQLRDTFVLPSPQQ